jgi:hypothetical protein
MRAKDLRPQAWTAQLGGLGRVPIPALHYDTFSSPVVTDGSLGTATQMLERRLA